jgi:hypothetical protein
MSFTICTCGPFGAAFDLIQSASDTATHSQLRAFRRRQNVHASGALFRTRPAAGASPAVLLLPPLSMNICSPMTAR